MTKCRRVWAAEAVIRQVEVSELKKDRNLRRDAPTEVTVGQVETDKSLHHPLSSKALPSDASKAESSRAATDTKIQDKKNEMLKIARKIIVAAIRLVRLDSTCKLGQADY
ncbi:hypothetical protein NC651_004780 [Populus alba x Populus x berolinensis]|nr:hypothetical protein NC651_004780 [Populus alba x Populus x berolinensis]